MRVPHHTSHTHTHHTHSSLITHHTSLITHHTHSSHITHHSSHITHHTSHITHHTHSFVHLHVLTCSLPVMSKVASKGIYHTHIWQCYLFLALASLTSHPSPAHCSKKQEEAKSMRQITVHHTYPYMAMLPVLSPSLSHLPSLPRSLQ